MKAEIFKYIPPENFLETQTLKFKTITCYPVKAADRIHIPCEQKLHFVMTFCTV